ncbi:NUDIX hydrolase [Alkaliphilus peptidifermentans]|uniref:8-oxo-dGTP diphosphatase n=1 Tax=Alkaliphilus peptidifermentans DSM 18978 TaxID=1120976 RepID=A0A1G5DKD2_9FIRM|nr:NUDIX domain-containing protein [Alkaliphilus peptidifermentans]SCY15155.1 8-oxo-dGTP diphosphatase [Alkaliphilus peptidifermentans DSM 18978]
MEIEFYDLGEIDDAKLEFAVINVTYQDKLVLVKHKDRDTWEIPGGHREEGESINTTAARELFEETGAKKFDIKPISEYSVAKGQSTTYGRLYVGVILEMGQLPGLEITEVKLFDKLPQNLTYPNIQPHLHNRVYKNDKFNMHKTITVVE